MVSLFVSILSPNSQWKICIMSRKNDTDIEGFQVRRQTKMDDLLFLWFRNSVEVVPQSIMVYDLISKWRPNSEIFDLLCYLGRTGTRVATPINHLIALKAKPKQRDQSNIRTKAAETTRTSSHRHATSRTNQRHTS